MSQFSFLIGLIESGSVPRGPGLRPQAGEQVYTHSIHCACCQSFSFSLCNGILTCFSSPPGLASPLLRGRAAPGVPASRALGVPCFPLFSSFSTPSWTSRAEVKESYCLVTVWLKPLIGEVNQAFARVVSGHFGKTSEDCAHSAKENYQTP